RPSSLDGDFPRRSLRLVAACLAAERAFVLLLEVRNVGARHDVLEEGKRRLPARKELLGALRARVADMPLEELVRGVARTRDRPREDEIVVEPEVEEPGRVVDVGLAAAHPGTDVAPEVAEDDDSAVRHVLARVVAGALDDGDGARVADREALAGPSRAVELAAGRAVENRVAEEDGV